VGPSAWPAGPGPAGSSSRFEVALQLEPEARPVVDLAASLAEQPPARPLASVSARASPAVTFRISPSTRRSDSRTVAALGVSLLSTSFTLAGNPDGITTFPSTTTSRFTWAWKTSPRRPLSVTD